MANWYVNSVAYAAVAQWAASHSYGAGSIVRQLAAVGAGAERCFRTTAGGTSGTAEPIWNTTVGGVSNTDGTITDWTEVTGNQTYQAPGAWAAPLARLPQQGVSTATPNTGVGTGWAAGDFAYIVGGTFTQQAIVKILTVSAGKPATIAIWDPGSYSATPGGSLLAISPSVGTAGALTFVAVGNLRATAATDKIFVSSNHAEVQPSGIPLTCNFAGTLSQPTEVLCVDESSSGNVPPLSTNLKTTAIVSTTIAFGNSIEINGSFHSYGINWKSGGTAGEVFVLCGFNGLNEHQIIEAGSVQLTYTTGGARFRFGAFQISFGKKLEFINTSIGFAISSTIALDLIDFRWRNTAGQSALVAGSAAPSILITPQSNLSCFLTLDGIDFSALGANTVIANSGLVNPFLANVRNCKLGTSTVLFGTPGAPGIEAFAYNCDSGNTNYKSSKFEYYGTETTEVSVTRVGGATDGITAQSRKIVTTANANFSMPFTSMPMMIWNDLVGSTRNITVFGTINAGSPPANNELWLEVEYFEDAASPLASFIDDRMANVLATPAAQTADNASTWNGGGSGAGWSPFTLSVALTAQQHGYLVLRVKAAKASTTYYIDPPGAGTLS